MEKVDYNNVFSSCYSKDTIICSPNVKEHCLLFVNSGLLELKYNNKIYNFKQNECVFIRRSHEVQLSKKPLDGKPFSGVFFILDKKFLASKFKQYKHLDYPAEKSPIIQIENHPVLISFFQSFISYRETGIKPDEEVIEAKKYEALDILLKIKPSLAKSLFDFAKPWKIDLESFMNQNYTSDMTLNDFAHLPFLASPKHLACSLQN